MLAAERRRRLAALLGASGLRAVGELANELGVSSSTVRRDLAHLQARGLAVRVRGGAAAVMSAASVEPGADAARSVTAKRTIAREAVRGITPGTTVMLVAGSTVQAMVPFLAELPELTVATNGLDIALGLAQAAPHLSLVVLGGILHHAQRAMLGPLTEENMRALHVDILFGGAWGLAADLGATGDKVAQARGHDAAAHRLDHVDRVVVLCDGSKLGRRGPALLAGPDQIDLVITDRSAAADEVSAVRAAGIDVVLC